MHCQRACSKILTHEAENNRDITAEVQVNYPNWKQKLGEKENFVISKKTTLPLVSKSCLRKSRFQTLTERASGIEIGKCKQKFSKSRVLPINFLRKLDLQIFLATPRSYEQ